MGLLIGVSGGRTGHPWNFGQTLRRSLGHRRAATLQQELSVVDDPGTFSVKRQENNHLQSCSTITGSASIHHIHAGVHFNRTLVIITLLVRSCNALFITNTSSLSGKILVLLM